MNVERKISLHKIAFGASAVLALIMLTASAFMRNCLPLELLVAIAATQAVRNIITAFNKTKDRKTSVVFGIFGVIEAVIAVLLFVYLMLQRCGVM